MFHFVYNTTHISEERAVKIELQNKKTLCQRALQLDILSGNQYTEVKRYKSTEMYFTIPACAFSQKIVSFHHSQQVSLIIEFLVFWG